MFLVFFFIYSKTELTKRHKFCTSCSTSIHCWDVA